MAFEQRKDGKGNPELEIRVRGTQFDIFPDYPELPGTPRGPVYLAMERGDTCLGMSITFDELEALNSVIFKCLIAFAPEGYFDA